MNDIQQKTLFALLPVSLFGSSLNWSILYAMYNLPSFRHSFGYLSANQALADAIHSTTFLLYFCPMVLLDQPLLKAYSHHCGFILLFCYELSVLTHLFISLNRLLAVFSPHRYQQVFSDKKTLLLVLIIWIFTGSVAVWFYESLCNFYYDENIQFLTFTSSELCGKIGWYGDFLKNSAIVAIVMVLDIITVTKVRYLSKKISTRVAVRTQQSRSRREIRFLKQTVSQGGVFLFELLTYFFVPQYCDNRWIVFLATSFAWVAVHAADGIVVIVCNPEIRNYLFKTGPVHKNTTTTNATSTNVI